MRRGRIGSVDTNIRHSGSESYDQGFVSIAKPQTTQGLLLLKHALRRTCADSASLDAMESASRHKANQIIKKKKDQNLQWHFTCPLFSTPSWATDRAWLFWLASGRPANSRTSVSSPEHACVCIPRWSSALRGCDRKIRKLKERSGSTNFLIDLAVHE